MWAQAMESVHGRDLHVNTLRTGSVPYSWLYIPGLAWCLTICKHACWERSDEKKMEKYHRLPNFPNSHLGWWGGEAAPNGKGLFSVFYRNGIIFPPTPSPLPTPTSNYFPTMPPIHQPRQKPRRQPRILPLPHLYLQSNTAASTSKCCKLVPYSVYPPLCLCSSLLHHFLPSLADGPLTVALPAVSLP